MSSVPHVNVGTLGRPVNPFLALAATPLPGILSPTKINHDGRPLTKEKLQEITENLPVSCTRCRVRDVSSRGVAIVKLETTKDEYIARNFECYEIGLPPSHLYFYSTDLRNRTSFWFLAPGSQLRYAGRVNTDLPWTIIVSNGLKVINHLHPPAAILSRPSETALQTTQGEKQMEKQFWLVWNPNGGAPTYQHDSEESARREAERLARNNPGCEFVVLASVGSCQRNDVIWKEHGSQCSNNAAPLEHYPH